MKRNVIILIIVVAAVAASLFFASRMAKPPAAQGSAMDTSAMEASAMAIEGKPAPAFALETLDGKIVKTLIGLQSESNFEDGIKAALTTKAAAQ